jgi:Uma2 family endonuclease
MLSNAPHETGNRYTLDEFLEYAGKDDNRYELMDGYIHMMASPNTNHQRITGDVYSAFRAHLKGKVCEAFIAPLDVYLLEEDGSCENVLQPDVFIVCDKSKIKERGIEGAPDLVVEVTGKSSYQRDYLLKLEKYLRLGVKEYWIINPVNKHTMAYRNNNGSSSVDNYSFDEILQSELFEGLQIDLRDHTKEEYI